SLYEIFHCDAFSWLGNAASCSIHAVVTDPPYGLVEYSKEQLRKRKAGRGGVWRIPPAFDGCHRSPVPRFTVLSERAHHTLRVFFSNLSKQLKRVLVPGAHVTIATNPLVSHLFYESFPRRYLLIGCTKWGAQYRPTSIIEAAAFSQAAR